MKTYLTAALALSLTVSALAQTTGDNSPKSPNRHHTRVPYTGVKHHNSVHHTQTRNPHFHKANQPKPKSNHVVAH